MQSTKCIKTILGWTWFALLSLCYSMPLVLFVAWKTFGWSSWTQEHPIAYLQMVWGLVTLVLVGIGVLIQKWIRAKKRDQRGFLRAALLAFFTVFFILFNLDDRKMENDYSWADVPNPPKAEESYALLLKAFGSDAKPRSQLKLPTDMEAIYKDPLAHKTEIQQWWQETGEGRQILSKLNEYEAIGDLTGEKLTIHYGEGRNLSRVVCAYSLLKAAEGRAEEGTTYLAQSHSMIRKILPYSRYLINKFIWLAHVSGNIRAAYTMSNQPKMNNAALQIVKNQFVPLTEQEIDIRRTLITEYIFTKMGHNTISENSYLARIFMWCAGETNTPLLNAWEKMISRVFFYITFKPSQTLREIKDYFDLSILIWNKRPWALEELKTYETSRMGKLKLNNVGYWILSSEYHISDYIKIISVVKVRSDLLAFYLDHKLGVKSEVKDFYAGIEYRLDQDCGARSAGPDGKFNTEDDIVLDTRK